jgi:hypothetical protein
LQFHQNQKLQKLKQKNMFKSHLSRNAVKQFEKQQKKEKVKFKTNVF